MEFSFRGSRILRDEGQGTIEYMLVLVVTVAIILTLIFTFDTAFQSWANNYFGQYLECLLETGELPSLGGETGGGTCDQYFAAFSLSNGRPSVVAGDLGSGGGNQRNRGGARAEGASGRRGGGGSTNGGGDSYASRRTVNNNSTTGEQGAGGGGSETKKPEKFIQVGGPSSSGYKVTSDNGGFIDGRIPIRADKEVIAKNGFPVSGKNSGGLRTPNKVRLKPPVKRTVAAIDADEGFTFSNFIRILIIAAIIIALVLLLGGQLLQIGTGIESGD